MRTGSSRMKVMHWLHNKCNHMVFRVTWASCLENNMACMSMQLFSLTLKSNEFWWPYYYCLYSNINTNIQSKKYSESLVLICSSQPYIVLHTSFSWTCTPHSQLVPLLLGCLCSRWAFMIPSYISMTFKLCSFVLICVKLFTEFDEKKDLTVTGKVIDMWLEGQWFELWNNF